MLLALWLTISDWCEGEASCFWSGGVDVRSWPPEILVMKKSMVGELTPVVLLEDALLCNLRENVPRQKSLYFCLCFFGICYRCHGSDQGWRSRNTPHRWVSFLVLGPGGLPGTDWSLVWDFSKFLQAGMSGTRDKRSHFMLIQRFSNKYLGIYLMERKM